MTHLNEQQLVELLYGDFANSDDGELSRKHLLECGECQAAYSRIAGVTELLDLDQDGWDQATRPRAAVMSAARMRDRSPIEGSRTWRVAVIAASLLVLCAGAAFAAGTWWQSRSVARQWAEPWKSPEFSQRLAQIVRDQTTAQIAEYDQAVSGRLAAIADSLAELRQSDVRGDRESQKRLETILARLVDNQADLRSELEALALAAESAITTTRRDLQYLNQLTKSLAGISR